MTRPLNVNMNMWAWLNVLLSVLIVLLNKRLYAYYGFPNVTLTCLQLLITTLCVSLCERFGVFHRKSLPLTDVLRLSLTFCAYVVLTNLSLQSNTVATYLVFKMATLPAVVAVEAFWCRRKFSTDVLLSLVSTCGINILCTHSCAHPLSSSHLDQCSLAQEE